MCNAGIVERVAWTNGSLHNRVQMQHWSEASMLDALAFVIIAMALLASAVVGIQVLCRKQK